jgi:hypothetical protein
MVYKQALCTINKYILNEARIILIIWGYRWLLALNERLEIVAMLFYRLIMDVVSAYLYFYKIGISLRDHKFQS